VRALNLVAALVKEKIIRQGREVVVVGGGAAGLTAAAGAATHGARVTLLEELYGVMEPQRNNRQRWIHPHIYDWPAPGSKDEEADLPLLGCSAGYAEQVVNQIERHWDHLLLHYSIDVKLRVKGVKITQSGSSTNIKWEVPTPEKPQIETRQNAIMILAVGFGLEPKTQYQDSYWSGR
jgi:NADPH-dependent 2,4-dienoyl-CoA reductase/sulfur reductase-like enzyme